MYWLTGDLHTPSRDQSAPKTTDRAGQRSLDTEDYRQDEGSKRKVKFGAGLKITGFTQK